MPFTSAVCFNTASVIFALQQKEKKASVKRVTVSIPQAVFTRCNLQAFRRDAGTVDPFQYRKRYLRVATACLETRPQTGLKKQIGKPPRFFTGFPNYFGKRYCKRNGKHASTPVYMPFSAFTQKLENLGFQLSFIIAGFRNFCQTAIRFSKTEFSCVSAFGVSYTGIFFRKKPSYF